MQKQIEALRGPQEKRDLTIVFITHDLRVAADICDSIVVMRGGKTLARGTPKDVLETDRHPYVEELLAAIPGQDWFSTGSAPSQLPTLEIAGQDNTHACQDSRLPPG